MTKPVNYETVRQLARALTDIEEDLSRRTPVLRVKGKWMAHLQQDGDSLLVRIDLFKRDILLHAEPATFYTTDFYGCHPVIFVRLSKIDRRMLRELLEQSWRLTAPRRLVEAYDSQSNA